MKILNTKRLTEEKFINLFGVDYEHGGKQRRWVFASRNDFPPMNGDPPPNAVVIVPIVKESESKPPKMLLIREFRIPVNGYEITFPAGLIDPGESLEDTAKRELHEETGLSVTRVVTISPPTISSAGMSDECANYMLVHAKGKISTKNLQGSEDIEPLLLGERQLIALCNRTGDFKNALISAKVWPFLLMVKMFGMNAVQNFGVRHGGK
jgi:ADP-ribose pyrophosphatase